MLFLATIVLFSRFAALFCSLILIALLYSLAFLAPLLLLAGPTSLGTSPARRWLPWWQTGSADQQSAERVSKQAFKNSDSAAEVAIELESVQRHVGDEPTRI